MRHVIEHITTGTELSLVQAYLVTRGHFYVIIDGKRLNIIRVQKYLSDATLAKLGAGETCVTESADLSIYLPKVGGMLNTLMKISVTINGGDDVAESDETGNNARFMVCYGIFRSQPQRSP